MAYSIAAAAYRRGDPDRFVVEADEFEVSEAPEAPYIAGMTREQWQARVAEYVAERDAIPAEQRQHEGCDHAYGYCAVGTFPARTEEV